MTNPRVQNAKPNEIANLGRALGILGDKWNMLILEMMIFSGPRRFGHFKDRLGMSDPVLSQRLFDLARVGIIERHQYNQRPPRFEYGLTTRGRELWTVFVAIWSWEVRWSGADDWTVPQLIHDRCGQSISPLFGCMECAAVGIDYRQTSAQLKPGSRFADSNPSRRYRRSTVDATKQGNILGGAAIKLLGDRWSVSVLGAGLLGIHRFGEMQSELGISPSLLNERLRTFVADDVLRRKPVVEGQRRMEYHLRPKGLDLLPLFATANAWANGWILDPDDRDLVITHVVCDNLLKPAWMCNSCGEWLECGEFHFASARSD